MNQNTVINVILFLLIIIFIVEVVLLVQINNSIDEFVNTESIVCPVYYCGKGRSPCEDINDPASSPIAFRYDGDKLVCQKYGVENNIIVAGANYDVNSLNKDQYYPNPV